MFKRLQVFPAILQIAMLGLLFSLADAASAQGIPAGPGGTGGGTGGPTGDCEYSLTLTASKTNVMIGNDVVFTASASSGAPAPYYVSWSGTCCGEPREYSSSLDDPLKLTLCGLPVGTHTVTCTMSFAGVCADQKTITFTTYGPDSGDWRQSTINAESTGFPKMELTHEFMWFKNSSPKEGIGDCSSFLTQEAIASTLSAADPDWNTWVSDEDRFYFQNRRTYDKRLVDVSEPSQRAEWDELPIGGVWYEFYQKVRLVVPRCCGEWEAPATLQQGPCDTLLERGPYHFQIIKTAPERCKFVIVE